MKLEFSLWSLDLIVTVQGLRVILGVESNTILTDKGKALDCCSALLQYSQAWIMLG